MANYLGKFVALIVDLDYLKVEKVEVKKEQKSCQQLKNKFKKPDMSINSNWQESLTED